MSRSRYILCFAAPLFLALGVQPAVSSAQTPILQPKASGTPVYIIQPNDVLEISVWNEPRASRNQVLVRPDGRIAIPLAQDVQAAGLNPTQLKEKLEQLLKEKELLDAPTVTVIVTSIQSYVVFVTGQMTKGGPIASQTPLSVLQALAMAGTFTQFAKPKEIVIIRGSGEDTKRYSFNYEEVIKGINFNQNFPLVSGDMVYVP